MSNNDLNNDLDIEDFDDGGFDDFKKKGTLGDMWRNNPMVKIGTILAVVAVIVGGILLFGGAEEKLPQSMLSEAKEVSEAPGSSEISSTMEQAIQDKNIENVEEAARTGGSAMPIPTQPSKGVVPLPVEEVSQEDPLERWRQMQEERVRQQQAIAQSSPQQPLNNGPPPVDTKTPAVNALSQAMIQQMQIVLKAQDANKFAKKDITPTSFLDEIEQKNQAKVAAQQAIANQALNTEEIVENIIIPAGTIEYAQLILEANTDAPGPTLAQIMSGPLNGAKILGSFTSTDEYLVLNFSTIVIDGVDYPIEAVAIDPDTSLPGVITEIDRRYFSRVILPLASEFITGFADAVSESGTTSIFIEDSNVTESTEDKDSEQEVASGISEAGEALAEILDDETDKIKPLLRVARGTPIGVLFVAPVTDSENNTSR